MQGTCPDCGLQGDITVFMMNEVERKAVEAIVALPPPVPMRILDYVGMFRSKTRGMLPAKTLKIVEEIGGIIRSGYIQYDGRVARKCSPEMWKEAIERMVERKRAGSLELPMKNHNYLKSIVYELADKADRKEEFRRNTMERRGQVEEIRKEKEVIPQVDVKAHLAAMRAKLKRTE